MADNGFGEVEGHRQTGSSTSRSAPRQRRSPEAKRWGSPTSTARNAPCACSAASTLSARDHVDYVPEEAKRLGITQPSNPRRQKRDTRRFGRLYVVARRTWSGRRSGRCATRSVLWRGGTASGAGFRSGINTAGQARSAEVPSRERQLSLTEISLDTPGSSMVTP